MAETAAEKAFRTAQERIDHLTMQITVREASRFVQGL
jgi:hypothetical protein